MIKPEALMRARILGIELECGTCEHRLFGNRRFCKKHIYYEAPGFRFMFDKNKSICNDFEPKIPKTP